MNDPEVPHELRFQRWAHDANLGKQTSEVQRLSPTFYQRFGATDNSVAAHLRGRLEGLNEYLKLDPLFETPVTSSRLADVWIALSAAITLEDAGSA